jgi:hypothetical protein
MLWRFAAAFAPLFFLPIAAHAQAQTGTVTERQSLINWYYAAAFGTGTYTAGDRSVTVLQVPFSHALQTIEEDGIGLKFKLSATLGFYDYNFNSVVHANLPDRISTLSVLPGFEWQMLLNKRWTIRPYVDAGYGKELTGGQSAWIYDFGVKSRFIFAEDHGVEFALANALASAGYRSRGGPTQTFGYLATGLDVTVPTGRPLFGRMAYIGFTPVYYYYFNHLNFAEFDDSNNRIREEFEVAVSLVARKPWSLKLFNVDRIGIAVRTSGDVSGISLFTSLPF